MVLILVVVKLPNCIVEKLLTGHVGSVGVVGVRRLPLLEVILETSNLMAVEMVATLSPSGQERVVHRSEDVAHDEKGLKLRIVHIDQ